MRTASSAAAASAWGMLARQAWLACVFACGSGDGPTAGDDDATDGRAEVTVSTDASVDPSPDARESRDASGPSPGGGSSDERDLPDSGAAKADASGGEQEQEGDASAREDATTADASVDEVEPTGTLWTGGHGDLTFAFRSGGEGLEAFFRLEDATLGDGSVVSGEYPLEDLLLRSTAIFERPDADSGYFSALCVASGEEVYWMPQRNQDARDHGAPFFGLLAELETGLFAQDELSLALTSVESPSGAGTYALWRDGFPPTFFMSSCDGIDAADTTTLPIGHDHFNMAFSEPGLWEIGYRVTGQLASGGAPLTLPVRIQVLLE